MLALSSTLITLALFFYSTGIWSERFARYLKPWHVVTFWIGFLFDLSGTYSMHLISKGPFNLFEPHTFTGQIAIWLMLAHALWASWVAKNGSEPLRVSFHRYSIIVWLVWLVPYLGGMYLGMTRHG